MEILILCAVLGGVVAVVARSKGFDAFGWWLYGALLFPIALAHVLVKPALTGQQAYSIIDDGKTCPDCAETIKADANVCRFCGNREFPAAPSLSEEDAWFASLAPYKPAPRPTLWQKLWWNPHGGNGRK